MANTEVFGNVGSVEFTIGPFRARFVDHDGPASYPTGGETLNDTSFGFTKLLFVVPSGSDNGAHFCTSRYATKKQNDSMKLLWSTTSDGAEVANAVNLSGRFCRLLVVGI